jgi:hypothetical protein
MLKFFNLGLYSDPTSEIDVTRLSVFFLSLLTIAMLLLKFHLLFLIPINQDEFNYLSLVYKYTHGGLTQPLHSFHVHFFRWLSLLGTNEVNQVIGARIVMYLLFLGTCIYLILIGRYYLNTAGALFSAICYISLLPTVVNGASFRHDSIATFLFLFALYYFLVKEESIIFNLIAGFAIGIALVFTIKTAIHLVVFGALILIKLTFSRDLRKTFAPIAGFLLTFFLTAIIINQLHVSTFSVATNSTQVQYIGAAYATFVSFEQFFPQFKIFRLLLRFDFIIWLFIAVGFFFNAIDSLKKKKKTIHLSLWVLLIPLFSILFYRNAFPYFYVFIMPTVTIFCGYMVWRLTGIINLKSKILCLVLVVIVTGAVFKNFITAYLEFFARPPKVQHQVLNVVHKIFPDPVPYIDGCSMVSSYPNVGFFMSSAGMGYYLRAGKPIIEKLLNNKKPLFLLENVPYLNLHSDDPVKSDINLALMIADWHALKLNFIHHWGPIWVVGKHFEFKHKHEIYKFKITVPGLYTVEGDENVLVDGQMISTGSAIELKAGDHTICRQKTTGLINLRWGDNLYRPAERPASDSIFLAPFG